MIVIFLIIDKTALFAGARIGLISSRDQDATGLLAHIRGVQPTFLLCMSHLWCEYYALFKRELEYRVVEAIMKEDTVKSEILIQYDIYKAFISHLESNDNNNNSNISESVTNTGNSESMEVSVMVDTTEGSDFGVSESLTLQKRGPSLGAADLDSTLHICIAAMRQLEEWGAFIDSVGSVLGIKDVLLLDWYGYFGGRVFVPVTGGGHTSEEVLQWMTQVQGGCS